MPVENDESTVRRGGMDRRTMIKAAAATGAAAWAAPVLLDSLSSPAAAAVCSVTPTVAFKTSLNGNTDTTTATWTTPSFTATAGSTLVVYIATSNSLSVSSTFSSITGTVRTGTATLINEQLDYNTNSTTRTHDFFCYRIAAASATSTLSVNFVTNLPDNCSISVYQVTGATSFTSTTNKAANSGTASLTYANAGAGQAELWGVAGGAGNTTAFNWTPQAGFNWTEDVDTFNSATSGGTSSSSRSFSFETAHRASPNLTANSGNFTATSQTPDWAAIRALCGC